ncbi:MAG: hydroxyacylglutathione hydrolase [Rhodobacteraceae bacterium]|jgi:hydroxyacylglutathione hydrolase|uniref:Hydroxyacylglutathione hydrolase n=1 Tax=Salipiger profundus TaxID=1229727 RepID=A0A1U7D225_9RHOB|nr:MULTISPECIES: hydroxyacylglutathione hydrolase [Salipiger]APX22120.1 hydroxyacylglutathione hydrolase [Salipiger profundus]MAB05139.1 hydroxyacylglutathione hydrolase [Paracoccaceae bacterium]GGA07668.1 hydroxyacylglutathione hydrolase [Salipiger profundus]SFC45743.1 hydroxyacylglutathione hydrolase [Salipiger profundus]
MEIITVPCLSDNYAYLVQGPDGVCLVDAPEAGPIIEALETRGWSLDTLLITHHHHDHVGGVAELRERYGCTVIGPGAEEAKLPPLDRAVEGGDTITVAGTPVEVIFVPGHTLGHVAFYLPEAAAVFTADSLMALGCGRVFEGTPAMMWDSLSKLAALPPETMVYSGHEYTSANARFALTIEPDNAALKSRADAIAKARTEGHPTAACKLSEELATNPFLRPDSPEIQDLLGLQGAPAAEVFAEIRARKDSF